MSAQDYIIGVSLEMHFKKELTFWLLSFLNEPGDAFNTACNSRVLPSSVFSYLSGEAKDREKGGEETRPCLASLKSSAGK